VIEEIGSVLSMALMGEQNLTISHNKFASEISPN